MLIKLNNLLEKLILTIVWPLFLIFITVIFAQVICRSILQISVIWLDEVARMCFIWTIMLGSAVALRRQVHYFVESIPPSRPLANLILKLFAHSIVAVLIYVFITSGWGYTQMSMYSLSTSLEIPWGYVYVSLPLAAVIMVPFWIETVLRDIKHYNNPTETEQVGEV